MNVATPSACLICGRSMQSKHQPKRPGVVRHYGRGLCVTCGSRARDKDELLDFPTIRNRPFEDLFEDLQLLRDEKPSRIAERLGISPSGIAQALNRHGYAVEARPFWVEASRQKRARRRAA